MFYTCFNTLPVISVRFLHTFGNIGVSLFVVPRGRRVDRVDPDWTSDSSSSEEEDHEEPAAAVQPAVPVGRVEPVRRGFVALPADEVIDLTADSDGTEGLVTSGAESDGDGSVHDPSSSHSDSDSEPEEVVERSRSSSPVLQHTRCVARRLSRTPSPQPAAGPGPSGVLANVRTVPCKYQCFSCNVFFCLFMSLDTNRLFCGDHTHSLTLLCFRY